MVLCPSATKQRKKERRFIRAHGSRGKVEGQRLMMAVSQDGTGSVHIDLLSFPLSIKPLGLSHGLHPNDLM